MRVDFGGVDVAVTEHALHHLDWDATSQTYGGGKGMPGAVRCQVLPQLHFLAQQGQLAVVADITPVRQLVVVFCQDVEYDRQQYDGVALVSLLPVIIHKPVSLYLSPLGKVDVKQVDVCKTRVAGNEKTILYFLSFLRCWLIDDESIQLFACQKHALFAPALHDMNKLIGVASDNLPNYSFADDGVDGCMDLRDGCVGHGPGAMRLTASQILVETADLFSGQVLKVFQVGSLVP